MKFSENITIKPIFNFVARVITIQSQIII